jgi:hypothetical protein
LDKSIMKQILTALITDIRTRTDLPVVQEVDDTYDGDMPILKLRYSGLNNVTHSPSGIFKNGDFMFTLIQCSRTANSGQLANLLYAETQMAKVFTNAKISNSDVVPFSLTISGYEVKYYLLWNSTAGNNDDDTFTREFELRLTINKE